MTDGDLVRQCLAGDSGAYEGLVRAWAGRVLAVCHARVGRADVAEELAQETLFRGYKALPSLAEADKFGPWICGIATRVCLDWLKAKDRTTVTMSALSEATTGSHDLIDRRQAHGGAADDREEDLARLMEEVERLPEKHREALLLYYYQDCTYQELAKLLGVSAATVNARLTQARQMLRERLVRMDVPRDG
jgi:RNA polymerase sigma-70 factor (ECF subfamily)